MNIVGGLIDFIFSSSFWDLIFNIFGLGLIFGAVALAFPLYRPVIILMHAPPKGTRGLPPDLLRGIIAIVLVLLAVLTAIMQSCTFEDVVHSILSFGDYTRIGETFSQETDPLLFNKLTNVFMRELILTYLFILPIIVIDCLLGLSSLFTRKDISGRRWRTALLNAVSIISTLIIRACYSTPQYTLTVRIVALAQSGGIVQLVFFGVLAIALLGLSLLDMLANNYVLSIFAFQIARQIVAVPLEPWQETVFIVLCLIAGYVADVIRKHHEDPDDLREIWTYFSHGGIALASMTGAACALLLFVRHVLQ